MEVLEGSSSLSQRRRLEGGQAAAEERPVEEGVPALLLQWEQAGCLLNTFGKGKEEIIVLMNVQETIAAPAGGL